MGTFFGLWLSTLLKIPDMLSALLVLIIKIPTLLILAITTDGRYFYFAAALNLFGSCLGPLIRSHLSKIVPKQDLGKIVKHTFVRNFVDFVPSLREMSERGDCKIFVYSSTYHNISCSYIGISKKYVLSVVENSKKNMMNIGSYALICVLGENSPILFLDSFFFFLCAPPKEWGN